MTEFEYMTPVIPQLNFTCDLQVKNISSKRCQILEFESLNCHNLKVTRNRNLQHMLIQEDTLKGRN